MEAVVCGIDPGLKIAGYAMLRTGARPEVIDAGVCRFNEKRSLTDRLVSLDRDIAAILSEHRPHLVAVEQLYVHYKHPRTAILMGHARGVILLAAARLGIEVRSYPSTKVKRHLTGNGRASKAQMQRAVQTTLMLPQLPEPPDLADAIAIALCSAADLKKGWIDKAGRAAEGVR